MEPISKPAVAAAADAEGEDPADAVRVWTVAIVSALEIGLTIWIIAGRPPLRPLLLRALTRASQAIAHTFGTIGLAAENAYRHEVSP